MVCLLAQTGSVQLSAWYVFFAWGVLGGFVVDALMFVKEVRASSDPIPAQMFKFPYLLAYFARLSIGGILATALGLAGEVSVPLGALIVGITAPMIIQQYLSNPTKYPSN